MSIVSEQYSRLVGVDTHAASRTLAVVNAVSGAELDQATFPTTPSGLSRAVSWALTWVGEQPALFVVEGVGSYGAGLSRRLVSRSQSVI